MNRDKMIEWIATHHVGTSSKTMWTALMDVQPTNARPFIYYDIPYDADDFSRCHDLVKFCEVDPGTDFPKISAMFPWYEPMLKRWDELTTLYESKSWDSFRNVIKAAEEECGKLRNIISISK